ncbi:MAG TPA: hypothetical protein VGS28_02975 [Candidatus Saccharimonadales bacterium]|nr:hypothetical protein [Candidatus Saccharimonadales bacterium]
MVPVRETPAGLEDSTEFPSQQQIERDLGLPEGTACTPTAFYIMARLSGYPSGQLDPAQFVGALDYENDRDESGWIRPRLSADLRLKHGIELVSWNTSDQTQDIGRMVQSGYLHSKREIDFFRDAVEGKSVLDLIDSGYAVVAAMMPGFATNAQIHTAILMLPEDPDGGTIRVIDPDGRNSTVNYSREDIVKSLQPDGACSIVLPPEAPPHN